ncbi:serine acetyltransferase [Pedobacter sp. HMF7056]|uniref:Serine acetyltransferase n=2 Tax=Hufsiella ginkgonis TaxID=2695274 RepID=A0A7K1XXR1_9SPHI|nr:serine acetyltransferase [Hufsiella ginkgonis]
MNLFEFIVQDWRVNRGNTKGRLLLLLFRTANFCSTRRAYYYLGFPYLLFYRVLVEWFFSVEIPWNVKIGKNLSLFHAQALVMAADVVIGENCTLRQSTTIGNKQLRNGLVSSSPVIGNHVDIGSNVCIIGSITVGDYVNIGCGTVVVRNVSAHSTVTGYAGTERKSTTNS